MIKCSKCGGELPDEAHFCMHCFSTLDGSVTAVNSETGNPSSKENAVVSDKHKVAFVELLKNNTFRTVASCMLVVSLLCTSGILFKRWNNRIAVVAADEITLVPVTGEDGEPVTSENGETVTRAVIAVIGKDGKTVLQSVEAVTDKNGEAVTNQNGEQVYSVSKASDSNSLSDESTTKKSIFGFLFGDDTSEKTEPDSTSADSETTENGSAAIPESSTNKSDDVKPDNTSATQPETKPVPEATTADSTKASTSSDSDFSYTEADGVITITGYNGNSSTVTVPSSINGKPVKYVGENAFSNNSKITSIVFESGSHYFKLYEYRTVFNNLPNLKEIIFPERTSNLTLTNDGREYEQFNFYKTIENCNHISGIYFGSKSNTNYTGLYSKDGVVYSRGYILVYYPPAKTDAFYAINPYCTSIEGGAFKNNPYLQRLQISRDLKYINTGKNSAQFNFLGCTALKEFSVSDGNKYYTVNDGVLYFRNGSTINGTEYAMFHYPPAKTDSFFEFADQPVIVTHNFYGNPYLETVKFNNAVYFSDIGILHGNSASPKNLKKIIFKVMPGWYYTNKLAEYGITVEEATE